MKKGVLIPVFNHGKSECKESSEMLRHGCPVILADDGSREESCLKKTQLTAHIAHCLKMRKNI